jgi:tetratricopeptide (TPR) repeat protein
MPANYAREQLCELLKQYGQTIIDEPKRCKSLLSDLVPEQRLEINLLIMALEQKVQTDLLKPSGLTPVELQLERISQGLHDSTGIEENMAYWAVESWALALNVIDQPIPRQQTASVQEATQAHWVLPPSNSTLLKQNRRLSKGLFFTAWLMAGLLTAGVLAIIFNNKQPAPQTVVQVAPPDVTNVYRVESESPSGQQDAWQDNRTGDQFYYGRGVTKNDISAVYWYRKAAEQGSAVGQCNLGFMYAHGYGVAKDYMQAVAWYRKAAEQNDPDGQNNLGIMYENGYGVAKDFQQAEQWYRKAVGQGHYGAQQSLKRLLNKAS